jgi:hypothetical protein
MTWGYPHTSIYPVVTAPAWPPYRQPIYEETAGAPQDRHVEGAQEPRSIGLSIGDHAFDEGANLRPRDLGQGLAQDSIISIGHLPCIEPSSYGPKMDGL